MNAIYVIFAQMCRSCRYGIRQRFDVFRFPRYDYAGIGNFELCLHVKQKDQNLNK